MAKKSQGQWWINGNYPPAMLWEPGIMTVDAQYSLYYNDLLSCVLRILDFDNLPDTIDPTYLKLCLYQGGRIAIFRDTKGDGALRALDCATAGEPDIYYMPRYILITNPVFDGYSYQLTPGVDCAVIYCRECDRYQYGRQTGGLFGLIATTAQLLADNTISLNVATKNTRLTNILASDRKITTMSLQEAVTRMYEGDPTVVVQSSLIDKLQALPLTDHIDTQQLLHLLAVRQYIYSHFYEQIGLKTHDQLKKERLITAEIDEGVELAIFNIDDMISEIDRGLAEANRVFGTDITLRLNPLIMQGMIAGDPPKTETAAAPDTATAAVPAETLGDQIEEEIAEAMGYEMPPDPEPEPEPEAEPDDDQSEEPEPEAEPDADQSEEPAAETEPEPDDDQSVEPAEQTEAKPVGDQTEEPEEAPDVSVDISGDVGGDVTISVQIGGDDDGDCAVSTETETDQ